MPANVHFSIPPQIEDRLRDILKCDIAGVPSRPSDLLRAGIGSGCLVGPAGGYRHSS